MNKEKQKIVPELRFPDFSKNWEMKNLGDCIEIKGRIGYRGYTVKDIVKKGEGAIAMSPSNIDVSGILSFNRTTYISWFKYEESPEIKLKDGYTVLVKTGSSYGKSTLIKNLPEKCTINPQLVVLKPTNINAVFLSLLVSHSTIQTQISNTIVGGAIPTLSQGSLSKFRIALPEPKEQKKIVNCISSLDDTIAMEMEKLELLNDHKKGLLQKLFPDEGEKNPQFRFSEFENDKDWEISTLNEISSSVFDGTHQTPKYTDKGIPFFSVENIVSGRKNKFISREDYLYETRNNKPEFEDVLITRIGNIGTPKVVDWEYEFSIYVTLAVVKKSEKFDSYYLQAYIQSSRFQNEIRRRSLLKAAPCKINMDELRKCEVLLPSDKKEQQKIAKCISSADELIESQTKKIKALKKHKKGLMQQLLPNVNNL